MSGTVDGSEGLELNREWVARIRSTQLRRQPGATVEHLDEPATGASPDFGSAESMAAQMAAAEVRELLAHRIEDLETERAGLLKRIRQLEGALARILTAASVALAEPDLATDAVSISDEHGSAHL